MSEWSPIWCVIIRVVDKICGHLICLITSGITDRVGPNKVLFPILIITITNFVDIFRGANLWRPKIGRLSFVYFFPPPPPEKLTQPPMGMT